MSAFSIAFLAALLTTTAVKLWLAARHITHIRRHRTAVPAGFGAQVTLDAHQKAADYSIAKTRLEIAGALLEAGVLLALTFGGGLQLAHELAAAGIGPGIVRGVALIALTAAVLTLAELPLACYRTFRIEQRFGFNKMTPRMFVADTLKHALVATAFGIPLVGAVLWLMARMGDAWWIYTWLVWVAFNLLLLIVYPIWIAPLFNKFSPLDNPQLKHRIEQLLARCGFRAQGLMVMDGSRRSSHGNAYFTGFGKSKRIVFFDTLLERLDAAEVEAVLAHELGHFRLRHVVKRMAWIFAASLGLLWLLSRLIDAPWFYAGLGVQTPSTAMALILFFLVSPQFAFLLHPLTSVYARRHEFEADRYAARHASAPALVSALIKLYKDNAATLTPDPLHSAFYDSHPPAPLRIARLQSGAA
ncbi:MAG TPA: M48 family metallopeptidase [Burkholderiales bacterium]|nr:M48 family metallopeptidase [Burkholderiales bacterium]